MELNGNLPSVAKTNDLEAFYAAMETLERHKGPMLRISQINLDGKKGNWYENAYIESTKTYEDKLFQDFTDGTFSFSPILTAFFCQWKFEKGARDTFKTTEFIKTVDNPLELYKLTFRNGSNPSKEELVHSYADYKEFQNKHAPLDELTGKRKSPYDFYVSIYGYHHESKKIIKMELKGSSRASWFEFQPHLSANENLRIMSQAKIRVGYDMGKMETGEDYYYATFKYEDKNTDETMLNIMKATNDLLEFLNFKQKKGKPPTEIVASLDDDNEVPELQAPVRDIHPAPAQTHEMKSDIHETTARKVAQQDEIDLSDIPF